jgi:2-polyprenyl-6-hydroxyphenyl methylase/3-demethylubiquinone-9 3-methyltransferase
MSVSHSEEVASGARFAFGENWSRFLSSLSEERILLAERSLVEMLGVVNLHGLRFLDIGSGSGLFSLAARRLGATVRSFDFDPDSVSCTRELRRRYFPEDQDWVVEPGSILDQQYISTLGVWDVVYSWGVLHHTGEMHRALANAGSLVAETGKLFVAIYNDQGRASSSWLTVKRLYNELPPKLRWAVLLPAAGWLWGPTVLRDAARGSPLATWRSYASNSMRGMSPWRDVVDWVGGLPFEVAKPEAIFEMFQQRGFSLDRLRTCAGGLGCNEFVFSRTQNQR